MGHSQVRKGYLRRQKDRQQEREKAAKRKKKREVIKMGKTTEGYKRVRLNNLQELQARLEETTVSLQATEFTLGRYKLAWNAEKEQSKSLSSLWNAEVALRKKQVKLWQGILVAVVLLNTMVWILTW